MGDSRAETKHVRNVKGHILDGRSCKSFLDLSAACEAGMQSVQYHLNRCQPELRPFMQRPLRALLLLSRVLTSRRQCCRCDYLEVFRGCLIKLTALPVSVCHFAKRFLMNYCINCDFFSLFLDMFWPAFYFSSVSTFFSTFLNSGVSIVFSYEALMFIFFFPRVIMHYTDSMLGK